MKENERGFHMKKIVLLVALMAAAGGAYADTLSTQTATEPEVQVAETVEADTAEATQIDEVLSNELATEFDTPQIRCPFGASSCSPYNLEPCEDFCGPWFECYRFCCLCAD
jgi:hypothetical protein